MRFLSHKFQLKLFGCKHMGEHYQKLYFRITELLGIVELMSFQWHQPGLFRLFLNAALAFALAGPGLELPKMPPLKRL
jgi:hypothetical protein